MAGLGSPASGRDAQPTIQSPTHREAGRATHMPEPHRIDPETVAAICECLRWGSSARDAAESVGVSAVELDEMRREDPALDRELVRAGAECAVQMARRLVEAAIAKDWRAAEAWLKRRRPDEWETGADSPDRPNGLATLQRLLFNDTSAAVVD
jgi:hypothetical protein